jgi:small subunit ribosomal protein S24e
MSTSGVTIRTRKFITNRLLFRRQMIVDVVHPNKAPISRKEVEDRIAKMYNVNDPRTVVCFGFKTAFGGDRSTGFALIYDSMDALIKFEPFYRLARKQLRKKEETGRKQRKERKNRAKKLRGVARAKALKGTGGKA